MLAPDHDHAFDCRNSTDRRAARATEALQTASPLHRIAEVRQMQGVSLRAARQTLMLSSDEVRMQENANYDLLLSELYRWQRLLDVPIGELLVEPHLQLSQPVSARAGLVKVMKTATTILESTQHSGIRTLAQRLIDQLLEIMPELEGVAAWPAVGQRRTMDEVGRIAEHPLSVVPPDDA